MQLPSWLRLPESSKAPRRQIIWLRAAPIFIAMMAVLFGAQAYLVPRYPNNIILSNGGLGLSLIAGLLGAFLISRFATTDPNPRRRRPSGPGMSKTQRRKLERAERVKELDASDETGEPVMAASRPRNRRRRR